MTRANAGKPKTKKFYYRRAQWTGQGKLTLENVLADAHTKLLTLGDRTFILGSGNEIQGARYSHDDQGLFLQVAYYTPGQPTSTIGKNKADASATIDSELAPTGKDYLHGDLFIMIKENHVLLCPSAVRESLAKQYFTMILQKLSHPVAEHLLLDKVAQSSKVKMISDEGVKEIRLGASLYEASLIDLDTKSSKVATLKAAIADQIQQIFSQDPTLKEISESENININLSIKFDGKVGRKTNIDPHFGDAGKQRLMRTSQKIIQELESDKSGDGFVIITGRGNIITSDEVRVSEEFKVEVLGKSLDHHDAWMKLSKYYDHLRQSGSLST